jgi:hypothetical protein
MKKYIETPLIYNYSNISNNDIKGMANLYLKSKSKNIGNYNCPSCSHKSDLVLYKKDDILFDNSIMHHMIEHNYKPKREILQKIKRNNKIKINATFTKEKNHQKFILERNQILILDSLMNYGKDKLYHVKKKDYRYSEHSGLLDFDKHSLEKILISGKTNRQDKDDPDILLPQNMQDALDYEFMFHTHPPTPYPGARAKVGILYEFPSISDIFHFIEHYNIGETQGSLIIAPEGMYLIHSTTGDDKIIKSNKQQNNEQQHNKQLQNEQEQNEHQIYKDLVFNTFDIQSDAIKKYGKDFEKNNIFYDNVMIDFKYINDFNKILKKYLDNQIYIEYIPRKKDSNGNYIIDKLIIELKPIEKKNL